MIISDGMVNAYNAAMNIDYKQNDNQTFKG